MKLERLTDHNSIKVNALSQNLANTFEQVEDKSAAREKIRKELE